jgi:hypothetical protein
MAQQGQVFELKGRGIDGRAVWAYRYRVGGRGAPAGAARRLRIRGGGRGARAGARTAPTRTGLVEAPRVRELVDVYGAQHDGEPETAEKLRWLLAKAADLPCHLRGKRWQPTATVFDCLSGFRRRAIGRRLRPLCSTNAPYSRGVNAQDNKEVIRRFYEEGLGPRQPGRLRRGLRPRLRAARFQALGAGFRARGSEADRSRLPRGLPRPACCGRPPRRRGRLRRGNGQPPAHIQAGGEPLSRPGAASASRRRTSSVSRMARSSRSGTIATTSGSASNSVAPPSTLARNKTVDRLPSSPDRVSSCGR